MRTRWVVAGVLGFVFLALGTLDAVAAEGKKFALKGDKDSPKASGTAVIEGAKLTITAKGLKPSAVYTVWFVNMKPTMTKAGAGKPPHEFRSDAQGNASFAAELSESPVGKWETIMIVRHPSGDPTAMGDVQDALVARL
jgi:hypothetical protein